MKKTKSAGGVVVNAAGKVFVVNTRKNSWSLPKGHIDRGEDALTAARREIYEESGVRTLHLVRYLGSYKRYKIAKGGKGEDKRELKKIMMFLFTTTATRLRPIDPANPEARWVEPKKVAALLTHKKDKKFFRKLLPYVKKLQ